MYPLSVNPFCEYACKVLIINKITNTKRVIFTWEFIIYYSLQTTKRDYETIVLLIVRLLLNKNIIAKIYHLMNLLFILFELLQQGKL